MILIAGIVLVIVILLYYLIKENKKGAEPGDANINYIERLIEWYRRWNKSPVEDFEKIENVKTMKQLFEVMKTSIPTCRSAKMISKLHSEIYVERDPDALRHFMKLMSEYYNEDDFQWGNSIDWKNGNYIYKRSYDKLFNKENVDRKDKVNTDDEKVNKSEK
jgi:hypothetical protein